MSNYRLNLRTKPDQKFPPLDLSRADARIAAARRVKSYLKVLLSVPFVVCLIYFGSLFYNHVRATPRGVETVQDFLARYGTPPRVESLLLQGRSYYRVTGEIPAPLGFPRGNPIYIFDGTGRLVDWTAESLSDPAFAVKWDAASAEMNVGYFSEKFSPK